MPLNLPDRLPAIELLKKENIFVIDSSRASSQDIRPLRIVVLNLMPLKITTETDLVRLLSNTPLQVEVSFMKVKGHTSKNTPVEHMKAFYRDFELMKEEKFDGMIITGAPVEHLDYEEVNYWDEIKEIFDWARTHVTSTLYICWAAQAGLYHYYGVPKYKLDRKMFGVFKQYPLAPMLPIFRGFDDEFYMPHSRHTEIRREDVLRVPVRGVHCHGAWRTGDLRYGTCRVFPLYLGYGIPSRFGERFADRHAGELLLSQCAGRRAVSDVACPWKPVVFQLAELLRVSGNSLRY